MFLKKYPIKNPNFLNPIPFYQFKPISLFSQLNSTSNDNLKENHKESFLHKSKNRFNQSKIKRFYEVSKRMNVFRFFKREINEQNLLQFLKKVQGVTLFSLYETISFSYLFNYLDFLNNNSIYLISGGGLLSLGSLYLLQKFDHPNQSKIGKFIFYQTLILSLSMILTPAITSISSPIIVPAIYVISAASFISSQICNQSFVKKRWLLTLGGFVAAILNSYLVLYGISYFSFVAVGNNPFVLGYQNFWVKNEIYLISGLFAWSTSAALKSFKRGETDYFKVALGSYIALVKRMVNILVFLLKKIKG